MLTIREIYGESKESIRGSLGSSQTGIISEAKDGRSQKSEMSKNWPWVWFLNNSRTRKKICCSLSLSLCDDRCFIVVLPIYNLSINDTCAVPTPTAPTRNWIGGTVEAIKASSNCGKIKQSTETNCWLAMTSNWYSEWVTKGRDFPPPKIIID